MAFQDFDLISKRREQERKQKLKKRITIAVVVTICLLIAAAVVFVVLNKKNHNEKKPHPPPPPPPQAPAKVNPAEQEIKLLCSATDYPKACEETLLKNVGKSASPQPVGFLKSSLAVSSDEIIGAVKKVKGFKFDTPMKRAAADDCSVLLNDAIEELNVSVSSIEGGMDLGKMSPELSNWLSAVLSYMETCIDGFPDGKERTEMEAALKRGKELGSNALAILSKLQPPPIPAANSKRSMLGMNRESFPTWMSRRMLKAADTSKFVPNVTVAKDGTGNYTTISQALNAMPKTYTGRFVIYVKEGVYEESVMVAKTMVNVTMYGDGSNRTIVTGSKNFVDGVPTYQTATFAVLGEGFMAQLMGFRNTAGPEKHQAVALRVQGDRSIFVDCTMEGYQDTLYAQTHRQFYRSCNITGTIDFIFGDAAAIFQNCIIYVRKPMENQKNIVTAQGRIDKRQTTGIVIQNSHILADETLETDKVKFKSYLGRPWKAYSRTVIMETQIGDLIEPQGWLEWSGDFALKTLYYAEFNNKGLGAKMQGRVKWEGVKNITREEALEFTVVPFLQGDTWLQNTDFPVRFGLY